EPEEEEEETVVRPLQHMQQQPAQPVQPELEETLEEEEPVLQQPMQQMQPMQPELEEMEEQPEEIEERREETIEESYRNEFIGGFEDEVENTFVFEESTIDRSAQPSPSTHSVHAFMFTPEHEPRRNRRRHRSISLDSDETIGEPPAKIDEATMKALQDRIEELEKEVDEEKMRADQAAIDLAAAAAGAAMVVQPSVPSLPLTQTALMGAALREMLNELIDEKFDVNTVTSTIAVKVLMRDWVSYAAILRLRTIDLKKSCHLLVSRLTDGYLLDPANEDEIEEMVHSTMEIVDGFKLMVRKVAYFSSEVHLEHSHTGRRVASNDDTKEHLKKFHDMAAAHLTELRLWQVAVEALPRF
ncbi:hypothetical protein PFISCL1PPCAC_5547, partial [Pristionchus fissidentatus]